MKKRIESRLRLVWCFVLLASAASADVRLPVIVSDNMMLQQRMGAPIEGWMPKEIQMDDPRPRKIVEEMDAESAAYTPAAAKKQLARALESWKQGKRKAKPKLRTPRNWGHQYPGKKYSGSGGGPLRLGYESCPQNPALQQRGHPRISLQDR